MMVKKFSCGHCKTLHDSYAEATECCPPKYAWECDKCGDWTEEEQDYCNACDEK